MKFPLLARMHEIKRRLAPVMGDLGVRPKLTSDEDFGLRVAFYNKAGDIACPVAILISEPTTAGWETCTLVRAHYSRYTVGHNGWTHFHDEGCLSEVDLHADSEKALETVERQMREAGVILMGGGHSRNTLNWDMVRVFDEFEEQTGGHAIPITCERREDIENLNFIDGNGCHWKVEFSEFDAVVFADDKELGRLPSGDAAQVVAFVASRMAFPDISLGCD
ncbi:hypothetical protein HFN87_27745 [Rhizobium laguerreae]|uniref:hypothetical protein n=1 Tax=Rhizobium laguerreae TaxID=1076926 RepID=UPI001C8FE465|nr:hypothetical protein [Rhizobium laguerreae]MBY3417056.1 hypothetical protein [Rhizobium laguerreae]